MSSHTVCVLYLAFCSRHTAACLIDDSCECFLKGCVFSPCITSLILLFAPEITIKPALGLGEGVGNHRHTGKVT